MKNLTKFQTLFTTIVVAILFLSKLMFLRNFSGVELKCVVLLFGALVLFVFEVSFAFSTLEIKNAQFALFSNSINLITVGSYLIFEGGLLANATILLGPLSFIVYASGIAIILRDTLKERPIKTIARALIQSLIVFLAIQFI